MDNDMALNISHIKSCALFQPTMYNVTANRSATRPNSNSKNKRRQKREKNSRHKHKHSHNTLKLIEMARRVGDLLISVSHAFRNAALSVSLSLSFPFESQPHAFSSTFRRSIIFLASIDRSIDQWSASILIINQINFYMFIKSFDYRRAIQFEITLTATNQLIVANMPPIVRSRFNCKMHGLSAPSHKSQHLVCSPFFQLLLKFSLLLVLCSQIVCMGNNRAVYKCSRA